MVRVIAYRTATHPTPSREGPAPEKICVADAGRSGARACERQPCRRRAKITVTSNKRPIAPDEQGDHSAAGHRAGYPGAGYAKGPTSEQRGVRSNAQAGNAHNSEPGMTFKMSGKRTFQNDLVPNLECAAEAGERRRVWSRCSRSLSAGIVTPLPADRPARYWLVSAMVFAELPAPLSSKSKLAPLLHDQQNEYQQHSANHADRCERTGVKRRVSQQQAVVSPARRARPSPPFAADCLDDQHGERASSRAAPGATG